MALGRGGEPDEIVGRRALLRLERVELHHRGGPRHPRRCRLTALPARRGPSAPARGRRRSVRGRGARLGRARGVAAPAAGRGAAGRARRRSRCCSSRTARPTSPTCCASATTSWCCAGRRSGQIAPGAHDMRREFKVLSRLWRHFDRAPRALPLLRRPRRARRRLLRDGAPARRGRARRACRRPMRAHPDVGRRIGFALVDAMADLHAARPGGVRPRATSAGPTASSTARSTAGPSAGSSPAPTTRRRAMDAHRTRGWRAAVPAPEPRVDRPQRPQARQLPVRSRPTPTASTVDLRLGHDDARRSARRPRHAAQLLARPGRPRGDPARHATRAWPAWACPTRAEIIARYAARTGADVAAVRLVGGLRALEDRGGRPAAPPPLGARREPPTRAWPTSPTGRRAWSRGPARARRGGALTAVFIVGIDVGGTFTDLTAVDAATGRVVVTKVPSRPRHEAAAVLGGPRGPRHRQRATCGASCTAPPWAPTPCSSGAARAVAAADHRRLPRPHRDRPHQAQHPGAVHADLRAPQAGGRAQAPLRGHRAARRRRRGAGAARSAPASSARSTRALAAGAEAIAVCLLHAYLNPAHERARGRRGQGPRARACPCRARPTWWPSTASSSASRPPCSTPISSR